MAVSVQPAPPVPAAPRIAESIVEAIGVAKTYDTGTACCSRSWGSGWS